MALHMMIHRMCSWAWQRMPADRTRANRRSSAFPLARGHAPGLEHARGGLWPRTRFDHGSPQGSMTMRRTRALAVAAVLATLVGTTACSENSGRGAAIGAAAGAGVGLLNGGIIRNAAVGAGLGAAGGFIYDQGATTTDRQRPILAAAWAGRARCRAPVPQLSWPAALTMLCRSARFICPIAACSWWRSTPADPGGAFATRSNGEVDGE